VLWVRFEGVRVLGRSFIAVWAPMGAVGGGVAQWLSEGIRHGGSVRMMYEGWHQHRRAQGMLGLAWSGG
jgi:hypothetical protein